MSHNASSSSGYNYGINYSAMTTSRPADNHLNFHDQNSKHSSLSKERRQFIIVNVFDGVLITLLWLLNTVSKGDSWWNSFFTEINIFDNKFVQTSLFDLALLALFRMTILLILYAALRCDHWVPVAITTSISTIFIAIKILFFFGAHSKEHSNTMPQYAIIISSLLIAWLELWLMPFRVLSHERFVNEFCYHQNFDNNEIIPTVSTPLENSRTRRRIRRSFNSEQSHHQKQKNDEDFHSALEYSSNDDEQEGLEKNSQFIETEIGQLDRNEIVNKICKAQEEALILLGEAPKWNLLEARPTEIRVNTLINTYFLRCTLDYPAKEIFEAVWRHAQAWNKQISKFCVLAQLDATTDLIQNISAPACGGYIAQRRFIDVRRYTHNTTLNVFVATYTSVDFINAQISENEIRGANGVNVIRITPLNNFAMSNSSSFEWIMNTDLKGSIPAFLIRKAITSFLHGYIKELDCYLRTFKNP